MECPNCCSLKNKVIDSRLTKDRVSIRRRRQCFICFKRFTTYESTQERMLPVLIRNKAGHRVTKTNLKMMLSFISQTLGDLSDETKKLLHKVDKLGKTWAVTASERNAAIVAPSSTGPTHTVMIGKISEVCANHTPAADRAFDKCPNECQGTLSGGRGSGKRDLRASFSYWTLCNCPKKKTYYHTCPLSGVRLCF